MKIKKEKTEKKAGLRIPLGMKRVLLTLLLALVAKGIAITDELFDLVVVEYFARDGYMQKNAYVGLAKPGSKATEIFVRIEGVDRGVNVRRIADRIRQEGTVSIDDTFKDFEVRIQDWFVDHYEILEIGGISALEHFPRCGQKNFPVKKPARSACKPQLLTPTDCGRADSGARGGTPTPA
jgi:hypothetical protein